MAGCHGEASHGTGVPAEHLYTLLDGPPLHHEHQKSWNKVPFPNGQTHSRLRLFRLRDRLFIISLTFGSLYTGKYRLNKRPSPRKLSTSPRVAAGGHSHRQTCPYECPLVVDIMHMARIGDELCFRPRRKCSARQRLNVTEPTARQQYQVSSQGHQVFT